jgi:FdhD protein
MRPVGTGYRQPPETPRPGPSVRVRATTVRATGEAQRDETVATEEPLEIRAHHRGVEHPLGVTMRTPGHDFELAAGWMFGEGLIRDHAELHTISYCKSGPPEQLYNIVTVELRDDATFVAPEPRARPITSACGVCGSATIEDVLHRAHVAPASDTLTLDDAVLRSLPERLRDAQRLFASTGGTHAAGLFTTSGERVVVREDVGRHNAVDKAIGARLLAEALPASDLVLQVSGRASFEIVAKAVTAGIRIVSSVSAPSSLAVTLATDAGLTLASFVHAEGYNLYCGERRIIRARSNAPGVSTSTSE